MTIQNVMYCELCRNGPQRCVKIETELSMMTLCIRCAADAINKLTRPEPEPLTAVAVPSSRDYRDAFESIADAALSQETQREEHAEALGLDIVDEEYRLEYGPRDPQTGEAARSFHNDQKDSWVCCNGGMTPEENDVRHSRVRLKYDDHQRMPMVPVANRRDKGLHCGCFHCSEFRNRHKIFAP